jgi:hypothetical protein
MQLKNSGEKELNCKLCYREAKEKDLCTLHLKAYKNLLDKYDSWSKAIDISWKEYLSEIAENALAGNWVKEVAKYLIETEET